jgi:hypothetical protein
MSMKTISLLAGSLFLPLAAFAQAPAADNFRITKISKNLIPTPQFAFTGAQPRMVTQRNTRWLEIETEFTAGPEFTDELTFKYYILFNGNLLTGEVTHVNILSGGEKRSVMYVPPNALAHFSGNRPITPDTCQNVAVQIVQQGSVKSEASLARAPAQWYAGLQQVSGFVLNKNQTPFAPLYWDRYEQIKPGR